jgi:hypothetical protein
MQFMPATFAAYGVDGDGDGRASIRSDADSSVFSAANYLTHSGVTKGPDGVRKALYAYNHATWYVNDVLHYAHAYGGGTRPGRPDQLRWRKGDPNLTPLPADQQWKHCWRGPGSRPATRTCSAPTAPTRGTAPPSPRPPTATSA